MEDKFRQEPGSAARVFAFVLHSLGFYDAYKFSCHH